MRQRSLRLRKGAYVTRWEDTAVLIEHRGQAWDWSVMPIAAMNEALQAAKHARAVDEFADIIQDDTRWELVSSAPTKRQALDDALEYLR